MQCPCSNDENKTWRKDKCSWTGIAQTEQRSLLAGRSRAERDLPHSSGPALGRTQPYVQWVAGLFSGAKATGCGVENPLSYSAELKKK